MGLNASTSSTTSSSSSSMISPLRRPAMLVLRLWLPALTLPPPAFPDEFGDEVLSIGPLKTFFFRLAKTSPVPLDPKLGGHAPSLKDDIGAWRTTRIFEGNALVVGVAGRTFTEWCGLRVGRETLLVATEPLEEVDEAFECV